MKRTPLRQVSKKRAAALREYSKLRRIFLEEHPKCAFGCILTYKDGPYLVRCSCASTDIHHMQGRGRNLNRITTWMAVCRYHHDWIHHHPNEARKLGYLT